NYVAVLGLRAAKVHPHFPLIEACINVGPLVLVCVILDDGFDEGSRKAYRWDGKKKRDEKRNRTAGWLHMFSLENILNGVLG
ncbi:MAG TPA: hypothetical protein VJ873_13170, partial [bacterium]|nr:hypothetical protein [bacterium]